jgi:hypothetical protein
MRMKSRTNKKQTKSVHVNAMQFTIILIDPSAVSSLLFSSCASKAGTTAAGTATYAACDIR